jgi:hypothetical protein
MASRSRRLRVARSSALLSNQSSTSSALSSFSLALPMNGIRCLFAIELFLPMVPFSSRPFSPRSNQSFTASVTV